jgi:sulfofructose kinase
MCPIDASKKLFDVLGLGCAAVDDLLYVPAYPAADSKVRIRRHERHCGGLTATALVAASRLGARCGYAGSLGNDDLSRFVEEQFHREGIDLAHLCRRADVRPVHSVIVVDESSRTRTIFFDADNANGALPDWPPEEVIRAAKVLFIDPYRVDGMIRASQIARDAGVPVVADFESIHAEPRFAELVALADHVIVSFDFAQAWTGCKRPDEAAAAMWNDEREAVVVTCGVQGCWYLEPGKARHQPAYRVETVDTTGCGDVFHGAYAAGLAEGLDLPSRVRLASATAALKAQQRGGQAGIPKRAVVEAFLKQRNG